MEPLYRSEYRLARWRTNWEDGVAAVPAERSVDVAREFRAVLLDGCSEQVREELMRGEPPLIVAPMPVWNRPVVVGMGIAIPRSIRDELDELKKRLTKVVEKYRDAIERKQRRQ